MLRTLLIAIPGLLSACAATVPPAPAPVAPPAIRTVPVAPPPDFGPVVSTPAIPAPRTAPVRAAPPALPFRNAAVPAPASCNDRPDPDFRRPVPAGALDGALLDRAVLHHTNRARCREGLRPLRADPSLRAVAAGHSLDMIGFGFFGHVSPVPGRVTLADRFRGGNIRFRSAGENLAVSKRLSILSGQPVYRLDSGRCAYSLTPEGPRLPVRSYDDLARNVVTRWLASPGHRKNLMNPDFTRHGASGAIDPNADLCESVNTTQLFAS